MFASRRDRLHLDTLDPLVKAEQAAAVSKNLSGSIPIGCFLAASVACIAAATSSRQTVIIWLTISALSYASKYIVYLSCKANIFSTDDSLKLNTLFSFLSGLIWTIVPF